MANSTHEALGVKVEMQNHPNADSLSRVFVDDYTVIVKTADWKGKTTGIYIQPDTLVNALLPEFNFLLSDAKYTKDNGPCGSYARIRAKKLRGIQSFGLLVYKDNIEVGKNYWDELDCSRYEPPLTNSTGGFGFVTSGEAAPSPNLPYSISKYDVENGMKYARKIFIQDEPVVVTVKYHGSNSKFVFYDGQFHCGSRTEWKKELTVAPKADKEKLIAKLGEEKGLEVYQAIQKKNDEWRPKASLWWRVLRENEELQKFCQDNPGVVVFGEVIGVQGVKFLYGMSPGQLSYRVFDIVKDGQFMNKLEARDFAKDLKWVNFAHTNFPFNTESIIQMVENMPVYENKNSIEEGLVVTSLQERFNDYIGRTQVKFVSPKYLEKS